MRRGPLALALSFALAAPVGAEVTYRDPLSCAAIYGARLDYAVGLGLMPPRDAEKMRDKTYRFLWAAYERLPRGIVPCTGWQSVEGDFAPCAIDQILRPQLAALQAQELADLVRQTGGSGPLPACADNPRCAACAALEPSDAIPSDRLRP